MPEAPKPGLKKLPPWAWIVALGGGALIGLILWRHSSAGDAPSTAGAAPGYAGGSGGGAGIGSGSPSPLEPVSAPTAATSITVGDVLSTMNDPATTTNAAPLELSSFAAPAPFVQEGTPYATAPTLPPFDVTKTTLPAFDPSKTTLPTFHLQPLPTPNVTGADPRSYGGVLSGA